MSRPGPSDTDQQPARQTPSSPGPADALPDAADGLALVKPGVRAQAAYSLRAPGARRKLNQNECPEDLPPESRAAVNLFQLVDRSLTDAHPRRLRPHGRFPAEEDPPRFAGFSAEFVDKLGEFPAPPAPR